VFVSGAPFSICEKEKGAEGKGREGKGREGNIFTV